MLTVSLHGIRLHAQMGLYPQEHVLGNDLEIDVDIWLPADDKRPWPFVDYTLIQKIVAEVFERPELLLETFVQGIHSSIRRNVPDSVKARVAVRKLHPPMQGEVSYAQVCYEG